MSLFRLSEINKNSSRMLNRTVLMGSRRLGGKAHESRKVKRSARDGKGLRDRVRGSRHGVLGKSMKLPGKRKLTDGGRSVL